MKGKGQAIVSATILLVDADTRRAEAMAFALRRDGHRLVIGGSSAMMRLALTSMSLSLILLDLATASVATIRTLSNAPLIAIANCYDEREMEDAYESGADDYLVRPIPTSMMMWRVRALMRRVGAIDTRVTVGWDGSAVTPTGEGTRISIGSARFDPFSGEVSVHGSSVRLTSRQSTILSLLAQNPGQVFSAERLITTLWNNADSSNVGVVKAHVRNIRRRLAALPGIDDPIYTVPGHGYTIAQALRVEASPDADGRQVVGSACNNDGDCDEGARSGG